MEESEVLAMRFAENAVIAISRLEHVAETLKKLGSTAQDMIDMKPENYSQAHHSPLFAELVCSNSLRSNELSNAVGLLKEEMRRMDSLIMESADATKVPAGGALAVDRDGFSRYITEKLEMDPYVTVEHREVTEIPEGNVIIASGPLTSDSLAESIQSMCPEFSLHFFDAVAPIVSAETIDMSSAFLASRYDKGTPDYVNCPMNEQEYKDFIRELVSAEEAETHGFEDSKVFEGCMPVEVMARRGEDTLRFGPMKPVGLTDPHTGKEAYAIVQLRKDNLWRDAPQYIYRFAGASGSLLPADIRSPHTLCRSDDRCGRIYRICRIRNACRH